MKQLHRPAADVLAVTMPCFGTTKRTRSNAEILCGELGVSFQEIRIANTVRSHFADIGQDEKVLDVTFENGQARVRTLELMDLANRTGGLVVGTGDLSELALGWATYNGDHMSMYGVNAGVPKTLVRYLVQYEAETAATAALHDVLLDILATPVSPELLPAKDGEIAQITEDLVGPLRAARFLLVLCAALRLWPGKDLPAGKGCLCGQGRVHGRRAVQVAAQLLLALFCPAVQTQLPAGWPQGGQRDPFAPGRLADAQRCLRHPLAGRAGAAQARGAVSYEEQKAFDQYPVCSGGAGHRSGTAGCAQPQRTGEKLAAQLIYGDNNAVLDIPLDKDETYSVDTGYYTVHIEVKDGSARFIESPCPDHICEGFGWLSAEDQTATCLPARAVLTIVPVG